MTKLVDLKIAALRELNGIIGLSNRRSKDENVRQIIAFMTDNCSFEGPYTDESVKANYETYKQKLSALAVKENEFKSESSSSSSSSDDEDDSSSSGEEYDPDPAVRYADKVDDSNPADDEYEHSEQEEEELADDEEEDKASSSDDEE